MSRKRELARHQAGKPIRILNSVAGFFKAAGFPISTELVEGDLCEEACRRTGLSDFGNDHFRIPLDMWIKSIRAERRVAVLGGLLFRWQATIALCNRLRLRAELKEHPEIVNTPIRRPIIVASLHRTGTTLLHKLLSQDPCARPLLAWETRTPVKLPKDKGKEPDPRMKRARFLNKILHSFAPAFRTLHDLDLEGPEECGLLLRNTFVTPTDAICFPEYRDWYLCQPQERLAEAYLEYSEQLQFLQWERPVPKEGHWVLKSPLHIFALGAVLRVMPDASIILIQRDPKKFIPSMCSIFSFFFDLFFQYDEDHRRGLMENVVHWAIEGLRRAEIARREFGRDRIYDVEYTRLLRDPMGTIREIYEHFGYRYCDEFEIRARRWLKDNPQNKFGRHRYSLEHFGLPHEMIDEAFWEYCERYDIKPEDEM